MAKSATRVGLDLDQSSIAAVQIKGTKTSQVITGAAVRSLPEGLLFEGEVVDVDGLASQLKHFWKEGGFSGKRVRLGVANQKIVVRTMEFPQIDAKELGAAIEFQAQEAIPIPVAEAVLDYQVLSTSTGEDGAAKQKVLIVAAQREMIRQFVDVANKAGLTIEGIDLQAFALARALSEPVPFIDEGAEPQGGEATAVVNVGSGITNLVVAVGGLPQFTRVINLGSETLVQALVTNRGITREEADQLRINVGLTGDDAPLAELEQETLTEVHGILDSTCEAFSDEIRRSIDYYHTQEQQGQITRLLVTGDGSLTRNMCGYLSQGLHLPVELGNPLREIGENKSKVSPEQLTAMAPRLAIAIGLALDDEE
jgi:type IV pilus assembly protein PilM